MGWIHGERKLQKTVHWQRMYFDGVLEKFEPIRCWKIFLIFCQFFVLLFSPRQGFSKHNRYKQAWQMLFFTQFSFGVPNHKKKLEQQVFLKNIRVVEELNPGLLHLKPNKGTTWNNPYLCLGKTRIAFRSIDKGQSLE